MEQRAPRKLTLHTSSAPWVGSKGQNMFFLKVVMLPIKLKGMKQSVRNIYGPKGWVKRSKSFFFSERSHVAYQIKGNGG